MGKLCYLSNLLAKISGGWAGQVRGSVGRLVGCSVKEYGVDVGWMWLNVDQSVYRGERELEAAAARRAKPAAPTTAFASVEETSLSLSGTPLFCGPVSLPRSFEILRQSEIHKIGS